jgi:hypothetical protein
MATDEPVGNEFVQDNIRLEMRRLDFEETKMKMEMDVEMRMIKLFSHGKITYEQMKEMDMEIRLIKLFSEGKITYDQMREMLEMTSSQC